MDFTTKEKVDIYGVTRPLLWSLYGEIQTLSKKKHDGTLNKVKIKTINNLLTDVMVCISGEPEEKYLYLLDEDDIPQYSDVVILLSQYKTAVDAFYKRYYKRNPYYHENMWNTEDIRKITEEYLAELEEEEDDY